MAASLLIGPLAACHPGAIPQGPETGKPAPAALRAFCKGRMTYGGKVFRFNVAFAVEPPDRVYAELSGRWGGTQAVLVVQGDRLVVLLPRRREYIEEKSTPRTLEAVLGVAVDSSMLVAILGSTGSRAFWQQGTGAAGAMQDATLIIRSDPDRLRVRSTGGSVRGFASLDLRLSELERPPREPIEPTLFNLDVPPGWRRVVLAEAGERKPVLLP
ncbi:MAG: hypothetical protein ACE5HU_09470 [Acidobacteriota bacterium]